MPKPRNPKLLDDDLVRAAVLRVYNDFMRLRRPGWVDAKELPEELSEGFPWKDVAIELKMDEVPNGGTACRGRYMNFLAPGLVFGPFQPDEDATIYREQAKNTGWVEISNMLQGRTDVSVKNRWKILKKDTAAVEAAKKDVDPEAVAAELAAAKQRLAEKFRRVNSVVRHGALSDPAAVAASNAAVAAATEAVRERERAIGELALAEFGDDDAGLDGADVFLNAFGYCLPAAARFSQLSSAMPAPLFDPVEARRRLACRGGRGAVEGAFCAIVDAAERCKEVSGGSRGGSGNAGAAAAFDRGEFLMHVLAEGTLRARNGPPKVKTAQGQPPAPGPAASGTFTAPAAAARRASSPLPSPPPPPAATSAAAATSIGAAGTAACQQAKARGLSDPEADASMARAMTAANDAIPPLPFETARDHVFALQLATLTAARAAGADADEAREAGMAALHREVLASTWVQLSVAANVRREELAKVAAAEQAPAAKAAKVEVVPPLAHFVAVVVSRSVEELAKWESAAKGKPWGPDAAAVSSRQQQKGGNGGGGNGGGGGKNKGRVTNQGAGPSAA